MSSYSVETEEAKKRRGRGLEQASSECTGGGGELRGEEARMRG